MDMPKDVTRRLAKRLASDQPQADARLLEGLGPDDAGLALVVLEDRAADVLGVMDRVIAARCLATLPREDSVDLIGAVPPQQAAGLLRRWTAEERAPLLAACPGRVAKPLERLLRYAEDTAGALMDPAVATAPRDATVATGLRRLQDGGAEGLFVVDREGRLVGRCAVTDLLGAPADDLVEAQMVRKVARIPARAEREAIVDHPGWEDWHDLPVVDRSEVVLGVLRYATLRALEAGRHGPPPPASLSLALGEMCWTMMWSLVDGVSRALPPRPTAPEEQP